MLEKHKLLRIIGGLSIIFKTLLFLLNCPAIRVGCVQILNNLCSWNEIITTVKFFSSLVFRNGSENKLDKQQALNLKNKSGKQDRLLIESLTLSAEESGLWEDLVAATGVYRSLQKLNGIITFQDDQSID